MRAKIILVGLFAGTIALVTNGQTTGGTGGAVGAGRLAAAAAEHARRVGDVLVSVMAALIEVVLKREVLT